MLNEVALFNFRKNALHIFVFGDNRKVRIDQILIITRNIFGASGWSPQVIRDLPQLLS
jgi:hypothetical protein